MKLAVSLSHSWLARDGPLGAFAAGCCWPQPTKPRNKTPDNAAPTFSDFHMVTPPLFILGLDTQNLSPVALPSRTSNKNRDRRVPVPACRGRARGCGREKPSIGACRRSNPRAKPPPPKENSFAHPPR